jgi:hypothetical protein
MTRFLLSLPAACLAAGLLLLLTTSCSLVEGSDESFGRDVYQGRVSFGIEDTRFFVCGRDEIWSLQFTDDTAVDSTLYRRAIDIQRQNPSSSVFMRMVGTPSAKGKFGWLGDLDRTFVLDEVLDLRAPKSSDCVSNASTIGLF